LLSLPTEILGKLQFMQEDAVLLDLALLSTNSSRLEHYRLEAKNDPADAIVMSGIC
jgi:hypothetical protein